MRGRTLREPCWDRLGGRRQLRRSSRLPRAASWRPAIRLATSLESCETGPERRGSNW